MAGPSTTITVADDTVTVPSLPGTVPLIIVASAQDKIAASGSAIAAGTTSGEVDNVHLITSQRDLIETYGNPNFEVNSNGNQVHGSEINEYGLLAAYSFLGVSNAAYILRANVDLDQLSGSTAEPTGNPASGTYWLDLANTVWGIFEWDADDEAFVSRTPKLITSSSDVSGSTPLSSYGNIGDYAINTLTTSNKAFYKNADNTWVQIGSSAWKGSWATVTGTVTNPTLTATSTLEINSVSVTTTGTTLASLVSDINNHTAFTSIGITAKAVSNHLEIYSTTNDVVIGASTTDALATALGISKTTYYLPKLNFGKHTQIPSFFSTDSQPRPTGSVWIKTTSPNSGASVVVKKWDSANESWLVQTAPVYASNSTAITGYVASGDASDIATGALYVQYDVSADTTATYRINRWEGNVPNTVTGTDITPVFTSGNTITINGTTVTLAGTAASDFVAAVSAADIDDISASVGSSGAITISNASGGEITLAEGNGTALADAGFTAGANSNWQVLTYTASTTAPTSTTDEGTLWYDTRFRADILEHNGTAWVGYKSISGNATTDPAGPIFSAVEPTEQSDSTALVANDIWIDTSDMENYPVIKRYDGTDWIELDNTDQTTSNGVLFADARNNATGEVTGSEDIEDMLSSDFVDIDAPEADLYPRGMILFNTRYSGQVVREFKPNHLNATDFPGDTIPTLKDRWVLKSGTKENGSLNGSRKAQRAVIVAALKEAITANQQIRDPARFYNLIAAPGYPELISDMSSLNTDRKEIAHIVGDMPFRLAPNATAVTNYANNANNAVSDGEDGLITADENVSVYYPSGLATSTTGASVVVPASHAMLRAFAINDSVGYPWFAAAGTRRGVLTNLSNVGYINSEGEFTPVGLTEGMVSSLYDAKVNSLVFAPSTGLVNMGNKTRGLSTSELSRINVARLINYVRYQLDIITKPFLFEPNDTITRNEAKGVVDRLMNDLSSKRAISDYLSICDTSNNTPVRVDANELWIDLALAPVTSVEFIHVPVRIKNTGTISGAGSV